MDAYSVTHHREVERLNVFRPFEAAANVPGLVVDGRGQRYLCSHDLVMPVRVGLHPDGHDADE